MTYTVGAAALFAFFAIFFGIYGFKAPKKDIYLDTQGREFFDDSTTVPGAGDGSGFDKFIRPMLRNFLPQSPMATTLSSAEHGKITELLIRSGNPWNIRPEEYKGTQILFVTIGLFIGITLAVLNPMEGVPGIVFVFLFPIMGYAIPFSTHNTAREKRSKEVQNQLPEALDLLVVALSAGQNFEPALAQVTPKMPDGLLKEEFTRVSREMNAGMTLDSALKGFARRAASDDSEGFAKAVLQAQRLGSDVSDTLKVQSNAARSNYEARLEKKIASLSSRMFIFIIPTMLPAILIIFLAPSLIQLVGSGAF